MFQPLAAGLAAITLGMLPLAAGAAEPIFEGATVRVRSAVIEAGWHTGRITRDDRRCSIVELDRPTGYGQRSIALTVVDALQLGRTGAWTAIDARRVRASEPTHCLVDSAA